MSDRRVKSNSIMSNPRNRDYQIEMERIATAHLKRIGAWLPPHFEKVSDAGGSISDKSQRRHTGSESRADSSRCRSKRTRPAR